MEKIFIKLASCKNCPDIHSQKKTIKYELEYLLIWAPYRELAGPKKLAVGLLPLAEPLDRPGECVLHIFTYLRPGNNVWARETKSEKEVV